MGWQTDVITQLVFNKRTYNSIFEVEDDIDECKERINSIRQKLVVYSTSRPEDILINRKDASLLDIRSEIDSDLEELEDEIIEKYKLECLKRNFDCRQGDFIENEDAEENIKKYLSDNFILNRDLD